MERLTRTAFNPEWAMCAECPHYGEPNGCNRAGGECDAYWVFVAAYEKLRDLEDKLERGELVEVVRCRDCKHGAPVPERVRKDFTDKAMGCKVQRGDWKVAYGFSVVAVDSYCDEGEREPKPLD